MFVASLNQDNIVKITDIEVAKLDDPNAEPGEKYVFSDGCGNISEEICDIINEKHELYKCSAY